jgi:hypothetical protein
MKLEITDYSSADIENVWAWVPESSEEVCFHLEIEVSEAGVRGGDLFELVVATPEGLRAHSREYPTYEFPDRNLLVFSEYSWQALVGRLERIVANCTRDTWEQSVACLGQYFFGSTRIAGLKRVSRWRMSHLSHPVRELAQRRAE